MEPPKNCVRFKRYLTGPQVCERYGGRSLVWLWRKLKADPNFPAT